MIEASVLLKEELWMEGEQDEVGQPLALLQQGRYSFKVFERGNYWTLL
jgi:hypothetical protein